MNDRRVGVAAGASAYAIWGLFPLYFPHLRPAGAVEILLHRVVWSFVAVTLLLVATRSLTPARTALGDRATRNRLSLAAALLATNWLIYIWAVNNDHVVDAALGYFVNPLVTVALGVVVLGEHLRRVQWIAVGAGATAVLVLTIAYGRVPWISLTLALTFAGYGYLKKSVGLGVSAAGSLWIETVTLIPVAVAGTVALAIAGDLTFVSEGPSHAAWLGSAGIVTATPLVLFATAARRIPLTLIGLLQYLTPVGQFLVGVLVNDEEVPAPRLAGFAFVWLALALMTADALANARAGRHTSPPVGPLRR